LETDAANPECVVYVLSIVPDGDGLRILSTAASPVQTKVSRYEVRYTTDGSEPSMASAEYTRPVPRTQNIKAAVFVNGQMLAAIASQKVSNRASFDR
jgi:hypothetical protein